MYIGSQQVGYRTIRRYLVVKASLVRKRRTKKTPTYWRIDLHTFTAQKLGDQKRTKKGQLDGSARRRGRFAVRFAVKTREKRKTGRGLHPRQPQ